MKKSITIILTVFLFSFQTGQQDPLITVKLPLSDWKTVIYILHKAAVDGDLRDPLINKIQTQAEGQLKDTSKVKPKN